MGSPAKKDDTKSFLRWHDPHQVKGSKRGASSQPGIRLPCSLPSMVHPWRRVVKGCLLFCRRGGIVVANKGGLFITAVSVCVDGRTLLNGGLCKFGNTLLAHILCCFHFQKQRLVSEFNESAQNTFSLSVPQPRFFPTVGPPI